MKCNKNCYNTFSPDNITTIRLCELVITVATLCEQYNFQPNVADLSEKFIFKLYVEYSIANTCAVIHFN